MPKKSYQAWWVDFNARNDESYRQIVDRDPFEDWQETVRPSAKAGNYFETALHIRLGGEALELSRQFAQIAVDVGDRAMAENRLSRPEGELTWNRAFCVTMIVFAKSLASGEFDSKRLGEAVPDLEDACRQKREDRWDDINQAEHLEAVRIALLADNYDAARRILKAKRSYKHHAKEHEIWKRLLELPRGELPITDAKFKKSLTSYFEKARNPLYDPGVYVSQDRLGFELGMLVEKLLHSTNGIDVTAALDRIRK